MPAPARTPTSPVVTTAVALAADVALVVVFAAIGRASHDEAVDAIGISETAWPFLVGLAIGWIVVRGWRHPLAVRPTGVSAWLAAVVVGMLLRFAVGAGRAPAFVIVASVTLALFLLGWRAVAAAVRRARSRARRDAEVAP